MLLADRILEQMSIAIAIFNQKGGAGKTPVTINLAGALASLGKRVLVCDLDGQVALTTSVGFDSDVYEDSDDSIYSLITELEGDVKKVIRPAPNDEFDVLPGNIQMYLAEKALATARNRERRLELIFEGIEGSYDYILVDCPPSLGTVTDNALLACRRILIPARMHQTYTYTITTLLAQIGTLENAFRLDIEIVGVVPVSYVPNADQKDFMAGLQESIPQYLTPVLRRRETVIDDARQSGCSIFSYRPTSSYRAKAQRESQEDYVCLAKHVMQRVKEG